MMAVSKTGIRQNVIQKDYYLSLDMAKELSMVERNEKGKHLKQYTVLSIGSTFKPETVAKKEN